MLSEALTQHIASGEPLLNNVFRYGSDAWCELILEARAAYVRGEYTELVDDDMETLESEVAVLVEHPVDGPVRLEVPMKNWDTGQYEVYVRGTCNEIMKVTLDRYNFD